MGEEIDVAKYLIDVEAERAGYFAGKDYLWPLDGIYKDNPVFPNYNEHFRTELLSFGYKSFDELVRDRKLSGNTTNVLDYMGGGYYPGSNVIDRYSYIDSMTAVRFGDPTEVYLEQTRARNSGNGGPYEWIINEPKRQVIQTNAHGPEFPTALVENMGSRNIPWMDLIIDRPGGSSSYIAKWAYEERNMYFTQFTKEQYEQALNIYKQMFVSEVSLFSNILSPNGGRAFIYVPKSFPNIEIKRFAQEFQRAYDGQVIAEVNVHNTPAHNASGGANLIITRVA